MISSIISRLVILVFGTLYPAYASYKAVRTKNLKEYVKWMMYWIVFALFTCTETFTDVFLSWFPFYYEVKIVLVLWLLSPATKGSSFLYRKFVHPALCRREQEIDEYIAKAKDQGYHTVLNLGTKGVNYATTVIMQTAIKGGGGIVQQIRKSYSLSDLSECDPQNERSADEADDVLTEPKVIRRQVKGGYMTRRSASESSRSMYFPEVDVEMRSNRSSRSDEPDFSHIKSSEDISSGYSSADNSVSLQRTASVGARVRAKSTRTAVTAIKRPPAAEGNDIIIEELLDDDSFEYSNMPALVNVPPHIYLSNTDPPFLYQYVGDQIRVIQVVGDNPLLNNLNNPTKHSDHWDQNEATFEDASPTLEAVDSESKTNTTHTEHNSAIIEDSTQPINENKANQHTESKAVSTEKEQAQPDHKTEYNEEIRSTPNPNLTDNDKANKHIVENRDSNEVKHSATENVDRPEKNEKIEEVFRKVVTDTNDPVDTTSLETSMNENDSADSDDEASFGTPDESPRSKRKSPKGKYGKGKAPPPPSADKTAESVATETNSEHALIEAQENPPDNLIDSLKKISGAKKEFNPKRLQVVNPIAEKKRRHKSKSPARIPKGSSSGIVKLLQLPGKLAFWNKSEDPRKSKENISSSSEDQSRRSSATEKTDQEFQNCEMSVTNISSDQDPIKEKDSNNNDRNTTMKADDIKLIADDQISFQDATDFENEIISHDLMEKSDALQKLIEAKLESHPEYKIVPLHGEIPTSSKSTDV